MWHVCGFLEPGLIQHKTKSKMKSQDKQTNSSKTVVNSYFLKEQKRGMWSAVSLTTYRRRKLSYLYVEKSPRPGLSSLPLFSDGDYVILSKENFTTQSHSFH